MPWPPMPGTARLENDIPSCNSVVGTNGRRTVTVPCNAIAYAMLAANETTRASANQLQFGVAQGVDDVGGVADVEQQRTHRDQRADGQRRTGGGDAPHLHQLGRLDADGGRGEGTQVVEAGAEGAPVLAGELAGRR